MNGEKHTTGAPSRAQRLREQAEKAENIASLARLVDATLVRASGDLLALASAAKQLAAQLEAHADGEAVQL